MRAGTHGRDAAGLSVPPEGTFHCRNADRLAQRRTDVRLDRVDERGVRARTRVVGLVATLADEVVAWTVIGALGKFGFTARVDDRLHRPVRIGVPFHI